MIFEVNTNRTPSFSLLAAGSFILRLHLTTPSTQASMSTTLTTPATTPPKKVPTPRGALSVAVCMQEENKPANIIRHHTSINTHVHMTNVHISSTEAPMYSSYNNFYI